ncbi:MAG: hypothetical protein A3I06_13475 [Candidatus Lindowbacteria bacterium RIFCSPLOWO2_02_FULL_62_12]|nr:MAG: hypothetical protein A3I06_13475 [Candidatus Lindowbacteria bacterium RIFCSPLOWO2_02_FULL_62_12]
MVSPAVATCIARGIDAKGLPIVPRPVTSDPAAVVQLSPVVEPSFTYQFIVDVNGAESDGWESEKKLSLAEGVAVSKAVTR